MAQIILTIPDTVAKRVLNAFAVSYGYAATLPDGSANPESKEQFAKRMILRYVKEVFVANERRVAAESAGKTAESAAEADATLS